MENKIQKTQSGKLSLQSSQGINTIAQVLNSDLPTFQKLKREGYEENLKSVISNALIDFLSENYPQTNITDTCASITKTILNEKPDWKLPDIKLVFNFITSNSNLEELKVYGNSFVMTPVVFFKAVSLYEEHKAGEREAKRLSKETETPEVKEKFTHEQVKETLEKIYAFTNAKNTRNADGTRTPSILHSDIFFDPLFNDKHCEQFKEMIPTLSSKNKLFWIDELEAAKITPSVSDRRMELIGLLKK